MKTLYALILCLFVYQAQAEIEYRDFKQPEQEQAYQTLISELRCLVCQNQTIADSNADLAKDLRRQVYEMLQQGKSRQDIVDFMTDRYGDFVMYKPALKLKTLLLWLGPVLFLVIGLATVWVLRSKTGSVSAQLSKEQQAKLNSILEKGDDA
ncbi:cytochrome c-type biogenesis protein [Methylomonas sp. ZR1]|uniref:cytochrome c-type biogenesis protein n=1 Tax=Methylomonas sp. ZR1 TaxID=1797072 RepID=UPI001491E6D1|nr:cytochrome c-type biogenesis protein [Methylomonas sp. ZR1]NOV29021.1 cytochrome c-type biogenesis protein CcmH [Methylomonas sp. ZR1]